MYGKINEKNEIQFLPKNGIIDGKAISNLESFLKNDKTKLKQLGYYEVVDGEKPAYDIENQYLIKIYTLQNEKIQVSYQINDITEAI